MVKLYGTIVRETPKAVEFHIKSDECFCLEGQTEWFPKSSIDLPKKKEGLITISVQNWLYYKTSGVNPNHV